MATTSTVFTTDEIRWYNNGIWGTLGYAVPAVGNDPRTVNSGIQRLVRVMGRNLAAIMQQPDVDLQKPPSYATIVKLDKLIKRARTIIGSRVVPSNEAEMEAGHSTPAPQDHMIYPVPYFRVRNDWLKEYCGLALAAISEAVQHTDNRKPYDFGPAFASRVSRFLQRIYRFMATELLLIPNDRASAQDFVLTDEDIKAYKPEAWFTSTELIDTVPDVQYIPTEDDLVVLTDGIPATLIVNAVRWPAGGGIGGSPAASTATGNGATAPAVPPFADPVAP